MFERVVEYLNINYLQIDGTTKSVSERIFKIGKHLGKLWARVYRPSVLFFDSRCSYHNILK